MKKHILIMISLISVCMLSSCKPAPTGPAGEKGETGIDHKTIYLKSEKNTFLQIKAGEVIKPQGIYYDLHIGTAIEGSVHGPSISRALVYFNFKEYNLTPKSIIVSANLKLSVYETSKEKSYDHLAKYNLHPITREWDTQKATWEVPWNKPGGDYVASAILGQTVLKMDNKKKKVDIALDPTYIQNWLNGQDYFGFLIKEATEQGEISEQALHTHVVFSSFGLTIIYKEE